jgi:carboxypeptidase Q
LPTRFLPIAAVVILTGTFAFPEAAQTPRAEQRAASTSASQASPSGARPDTADLDAIARIKAEGLQRSQVMDTLWFLTEVHGPRLTNSPQIKEAAKWAMERLRGWGLANVRQESWGPFGRGWSNDKLTANVLSPQPFPLIAFPRAWTPGTPGTVTADAAVAVLTSDADLAGWTGKLRGKIVLISRNPDVRAQLTPLGRRLTDAELQDLQGQPVTATRARGGRAGGARPEPNFTYRLMQFFAREGVVATLEPGTGRSDHGAILVSNAPRQYRDGNDPATVPQLIVATEHYNRIARLLDSNMPVRLELTIANRFHDGGDAFNVLAEIPGTDKADEVVMLGAHFDSWHAGTGATDNASGSAAMMEAMRILKTSGLTLRRTVRLALWTGEEQGLLGSRAYVKQQFGEPDTMRLLPGHARLSAYFNMDNGTGAIRGVYLQGNEAVRPAFAAWMEPFRALGMTTLTIRGTGGTDHLAFDEVGLPGFQFVQDPIEYGTHSHHTNMDVYDRIQPEDMLKNSVIIASFVYHAANRDERLPRKPLPQPRPAPAATP